MEDEKKPGSKKILIIVGVIVGLLLLIGAGLAVYFFFFKKESGTEPDDDDDVTGKKLWLRFNKDSTSDNPRLENGEALAVCKKNDAVLATRKNLDLAYEKGFEYCTFGWFDNNGSKVTPNHARIMQQADPTCVNSYKGVEAHYSLPFYNFGVFCVGEEVPDDKYIVKSVDLD